LSFYSVQNFARYFLKIATPLDVSGGITEDASSLTFFQNKLFFVLSLTSSILVGVFWLFHRLS